MVKDAPAMWETWVRSLGKEDPLEEGMTTHSGILAWRIAMNRGAWWAAVHGVTRSGTRLKRLSISSSSSEVPRIGKLMETENMIVFSINNAINFY